MNKTVSAGNANKYIYIDIVLRGSHVTSQIFCLYLQYKYIKKLFYANRRYDISIR